MQASTDPAHLDAFRTKMISEGIPSVIVDTFSFYYRQVAAGETGTLCNRDITAVDPKELKNPSGLIGYESAGRRALPHAVMIKLNGGLGTSMGLTKAKSLLEVKNGKSFLEIIVRQAEAYGIRLALMNSFHTDEDTRKALDLLHFSLEPLLFLQYKYPKILKKGLSPAIWPENPMLEWNPPGHGDIYMALHTSGTLDRLLEEDIQYAFISNSDNLGATIDESLLGYFVENEFPFMMEVAERTPTDMKGGHLARRKDGRLVLREIAQCPEDERHAFEDIRLFKFFNTNNIWVNLRFLKNLIDKNKAIYLSLILNPKFLDPRDETSPRVFQIETAMGSAISLFEGATAVKVHRSRLIPVKKCNDLLLVRSDVYGFSEKHTLVPNPERRFETCSIKLDPRYYGNIDMFNDRFKYGAPSLIDCSALSIEGNVFFEGNIAVKGAVTIVNRSAAPVFLRQGSVVDRDLRF